MISMGHLHSNVEIELVRVFSQGHQIMINIQRGIGICSKREKQLLIHGLIDYKEVTWNKWNQSQIIISLGTSAYKPRKIQACELLIRVISQYRPPDKWLINIQRRGRRLLEGMEMMLQILGAASLACRERELENCFFDHLVGHFRMQNVPQKLHSLHKPRPWEAEARVIAYVNRPSLHRWYGPKVWNAAQNLHLKTNNGMSIRDQHTSTHSSASCPWSTHTLWLGCIRHTTQEKPSQTLLIPKMKLGSLLRKIKFTSSI